MSVQIANYIIIKINKNKMNLKIIEHSSIILRFEIKLKKCFGTILSSKLVIQILVRILRHNIFLNFYQ